MKQTTGVILESNRPRLSLPEVEVAIESFSSADWSRAFKLAEFYSHNLPGMAGEDLLQEAIAKFLEGARVWPTEVEAIVVLGKALRSIASNERKKYKELNSHVQIDSTDNSADSDDTREVVEPRTDITPLDMLDGRSQLDTLYALVTGDEDVELVLMAWSEGLRGKGAAELAGLDAKRYDAARNRLIRKLAPLAKQRDKR